MTRKLKRKKKREDTCLLSFLDLKSFRNTRLIMNETDQQTIFGWAQLNDNGPRKEDEIETNVTTLKEKKGCEIVIEKKREEMISVSNFLNMMSNMNTRRDTMMQLMQHLGFKEVSVSTYKMRLLFFEKADRVKATESAELNNYLLLFFCCINWSFCGGTDQWTKSDQMKICLGSL